MDFKRIYEPGSGVELMAVKTLFDEHGIRYTVEGEGMRSVLGGIDIANYSSAPVLVREDDYERASALLRKFLEEKRRHQPATRRKRGLLAQFWLMLRAIFLGLLFPVTWIIMAVPLWRRRRKMSQPGSPNSH